MKKVICFFLTLVLFLTGCTPAVPSETTVSETETESESIPEPIIKDSYYFALINSDYLTQNDNNAIKAIIDSYIDHEVYLIDVKGIKSASEVYDLLKNEAKDKHGKLDGIQIFGTSDMVPPFVVDYKIQLRDSFSTGNAFFSDYFYSNFNNDSSALTTFNIADNFSLENPLDLTPEWRVARLPLGSGEFAKYAINYDGFLAENKEVSIASFSSPIFRYSQTASVDDFAHFFTRARDEWKIIDSVTLYANKKGDYITTSEVIDDISLSALSSVNKQGVFEFFLSGHGSQRGMMRTYFDGNKENNDYFLTLTHFRNTFKTNPYFLNLHACNTAEGLDYNLIREALNNNCLGAFAATALIANNGIDCRDSPEEMKSSGNFFYFYYLYLNALNNTNRSRALLEAQKGYESVLSERSKMDIDYSANYQFGYHNLLCYSNLSILEPDANTLPVFEFNETEEPVIEFGKEYVVITQGQEIEESLTLSVSTKNYGTNAYFSFDNATSVLLDNGYIRFTVDVKGKKDGAVYITSSDFHANHGYQVLPVANCTLSIDIPIEIFESEQFLTLAFEYATSFQICTITGFESLLK